MAVQGKILELDRCVHCGVDKPSCPAITDPIFTNNHSSSIEKYWRVYACTRCGGAILAGSPKGSKNIHWMYPESKNVDDEIPDRAKDYLEQAINSLNAPAGAVMLSASSIDSMLKYKGLKDGGLYSRIKLAATNNLITAEMAEWAHDVRLDANDQRHADDEAPLPTEADAKRVIEFTKALATFLFVLPARVQRGISQAKET